MKEKITVLIVEDDEVIADALIDSFQRLNQRSKKYNFVAEKAMITEDLSPLIPYAKIPFDFYIIDLEFKGAQKKQLTGFDVIRNITPFLIKKRRDLKGRIIIYSIHNTFENAVKAMELGIMHFYYKLKFHPKKLVKEIERILEKENSEIMRARYLNELLKKKQKAWIKEHKGKVVAIVDQTVVAKGDSHFETILNYNKILKKHKGWPNIPDLIEIT